MKVTWTKGLSTQEKEAIRASFQASGDLRARLKVLANEKIISMRKKRVLENAYESPNWAFQQADACGYERALEEIISLLE